MKQIIGLMEKLETVRNSSVWIGPAYVHIHKETREFEVLTQDRHVLISDSPKYAFLFSIDLYGIDRLLSLGNPVLTTYVNSFIAKVPDMKEPIIYDPVIPDYDDKRTAFIYVRFKVDMSSFNEDDMLARHKAPTEEEAIRTQIAHDVQGAYDAGFFMGNFKVVDVVVS